jgi:hypothetical protein
MWHLQTPATPDGSLVMSLGQRFESARRLSRRGAPVLRVTSVAAAK